MSLSSSRFVWSPHGVVGKPRRRRRKSTSLLQQRVTRLRLQYGAWVRGKKHQGRWSWSNALVPDYARSKRRRKHVYSTGAGRIATLAFGSHSRQVRSFVLAFTQIILSCRRHCVYLIVLASLLLSSAVGSLTLACSTVMGFHLSYSFKQQRACSTPSSSRP